MFPFIYLLFPCTFTKLDQDWEGGAKKWIQLEAYIPLSSLKLLPLLESHPWGGFPSTPSPCQPEIGGSPWKEARMALPSRAIYFVNFLCGRQSAPSTPHVCARLWTVPGTKLGLPPEASQPSLSLRMGAPRLAVRCSYSRLQDISGSQGRGRRKSYPH